MKLKFEWPWQYDQVGLYADVYAFEMEVRTIRTTEDIDGSIRMLRGHLKVAVKLSKRIVRYSKSEKIGQSSTSAMGYVVLNAIKKVLLDLKTALEAKAAKQAR